MARLKMEQALPIIAIIKGLRDGGEVTGKTIDAIAAALRESASISDEWGHRDTSEALRSMADDVEANRFRY